MNWEILENMEISIDPEEVKRVVGAINGKDYDAGGALSDRIGRAVELAGELIEPAAVYTLTEGRNIEGPPVFALLEEMALSVCTIGEKLEKKARSLAEEGDIFDSMVVDAAGSAAVEETANYVNGIIRDIARKKGKRTSLRASPGYGNWDIKSQKHIFSIAPADRIGVTLGEGMMMRPVKSISFAVHISENPVRLRSANDCSRCSFKDCPYRRRV